MNSNIISEAEAYYFTKLNQSLSFGGALGLLGGLLGEGLLWGSSLGDSLGSGFGGGGSSSSFG